MPRLFIKVRLVRYYGCALIYGKCRLNSNGHSKFFDEVTDCMIIGGG